MLAADESGTPLFLGEDLLAYLVLALGAALFVGNLLAVIRPPDEAKRGDLERRSGGSEPGDGRLGADRRAVGARLVGRRLSRTSDGDLRRRR